jgi:hypothetical protein
VSGESRILPRAAAFGCLVFALYLSNGRTVTEGDVMPTMLLPIAILRGDGPYLDRFASLLGPRGERCHGVAYARGHLVSRYPIAPALAALPTTAVQMAALDRRRPSWSRGDQHGELFFFALFMSKTSHAFLTALAGSVLLAACLRMGARPIVAWTCTAAGSVGSTLWSVASQGAWQHGFAALGLAAAIALLWEDPPRGEAKGGARAPFLRLLFAGFAAAAMVAARSLNVVFALALAGVAVQTWRVRAWPFFVFPLLVGGALVAYNVAFFGALEGGQQQLEALHRSYHGVEGTWTGDLLDGGLGTLASPSRGLFVFSPWILLTLALLPALGWRALPPIARWLLPALAVYALLLAKYPVWWGGWSFGPRFWTDAVPAFVVLFCAGLDRATGRQRAWLAPAIVLVLVSAAIHALGAFAYPSSWNATPTNVDRAHERLWDWRDSEITRCLSEGPQARFLWRWPPKGSE